MYLTDDRVSDHEAPPQGGRFVVARLPEKLTPLSVLAKDSKKLSESGHNGGQVDTVQRRDP